MPLQRSWAIRRQCKESLFSCCTPALGSWGGHQLLCPGSTDVAKGNRISPAALSSPAQTVICRGSSAGLWWNCQSCTSTLGQENILLAFPNPMSNPTSWFHCWKPQSTPPPAIHSKASSPSSAHNYFLLRCLLALQVFSPWTDTQDLPWQKICSFFLFITWQRNLQRDRKKGKRKG